MATRHRDPLEQHLPANPFGGNCLRALLPIWSPLTQFSARWDAGTKPGRAQLPLEVLAPLGLELWEGSDPSNWGLCEMSTISLGNLILGGDSSLVGSDGDT